VFLARLPSPGGLICPWDLSLVPTAVIEEQFFENSVSGVANSFSFDSKFIMHAPQDPRMGDKQVHINLWLRPEKLEIILKN
jgi:hypothetical protein